MNIAPPYDRRVGLGYGVTDDKFHKPRKMNNTYPYIEYESLPDYEDDESRKAINKKVVHKGKTGDFPLKTNDPFYFAAGNIKLSDCFERPDLVLQEVFALGKSMVSTPQTSKNRGASLGRGSGSSFVPGVGSYKRTGTKKGYFSSPPKPKVKKAELSPDDAEDIPITDMEDLAVKQSMRNGTFSQRRGIFK